MRPFTTVKPITPRGWSRSPYTAPAAPLTIAGRTRAIKRGAEASTVVATAPAQWTGGRERGVEDTTVMATLSTAVVVAYAVLFLALALRVFRRAAVR